MKVEAYEKQKFKKKLKIWENALSAVVNEKAFQESRDWCTQSMLSSKYLTSVTAVPSSDHPALSARKGNSTSDRIEENPRSWFFAK